MASFRSVAATGLRAVYSRPALSSRLPALSRAASDAPATSSPSQPPAAKMGESGMVKQEGAAQGQPRHGPDYNAVMDYRTSNFSPIPMRVMDGSEPGEDTPAAVLSGAPIELQARTVRIYKPAKTATQSGDWNSHHWRMDWDPLTKGHRWENPLMGWQSSADFMQGTHLNFQTKEDAIRFANKQGYEFFVQEPNERRTIPKAYADQFVHSAKKLKQVRTK
ncbi:probable NADH-ubiquinone oxidoreductase 21 kDa subunit, mitochondrial precursor [Ramularia collo-cygni]|uniref:NADH dehydrogenase [ubiquinone] iron-sulfur protein 4, mitochondrial n=1 Tax=Ramularia collo-cygni TaxID=112498 RepID=A0A2D3VMT6_9PEZI|nr:probable NADH-ubiquinone oxidoreductase 21 kDa subunit, mitochondrial precursor [Ramularia collo-cygni]CZT25199.1 probable NADH-ubiquinone oxidoreductase 21 kDa subunit, mitochondrial precursor [Ramularia collo-cygni]